MMEAGWSGADGCGDPLLTAPVQAAALLGEGLASACLSPNLAEVEGGFAAAVRLTHRTAGVRLRLVRELLDRQASTRYPRAAVRAFMARECVMSDGQARSEIAAALATDPRGPLPGVGAALAAGNISREHVDVAVAALAKLPARVVTARAGEIDASFTQWSQQWPVPEVKAMAAQMVAALCPADADEAAEETFELRAASVAVDLGGAVHVAARLDAAGGALFKAVLEELAGPAHGPRDASGSGDARDVDGGDPAMGAADRDGREAPALDERSREQRLADGLVEMARLAQVGMGSEAPTAEPTRLVVVTTIEQLAHPAADPHAGEPGSQGAEAPVQQVQPQEQAADAAEQDQLVQPEPATPPTPSPTPSPTPQPTAPASASGELPVECAAPGLARALGVGLLAATTLHRLACDSVVERVLLDRRGAVVAMQTLGRFATPAQARALAARDGGCARPGCGAPPARCDVHHVTWWSRGGQTRVDDMVLLCGPDHTLIHREDWQIVMEHGVPWFIPPPWIDPDQTPIRNTLHTALDAARRLGQQLRQPPRQPPLAA